MRVPSLALVVLTSLYSPLLVGAATTSGAPTNFRLDGKDLIYNQTYTLTWDESDAVYIGALYLVQDQLVAAGPQAQSLLVVQTIINVTSVLCAPGPCATQLTRISAVPFTFTPSNLVTSKPVTFDISWATAATVPPGTTMSSELSGAFTIVAAGGSGGVASKPTPTASNDSNGIASQTGSPATGVAGPVAGVPPTNPDEGSGGLSTGAKVGIAIGAVGAVLIIIIVALLLWRRSRQRKLKDLPGGTMAFNDDRGSSMNRDLTAEKDMQILNSQVGVNEAHETGRHGPAYTNPHSHEPQHASQENFQSPVASWPHNKQRGSYDEMIEGSQVPPQVPTPPAVAGAPSGLAAASASTTAPGVSRKAVAGPAKLFHEPGMSDDEVARLEEEERRIDEAIAEAERRRNGSTA